MTSRRCCRCPMCREAPENIQFDVTRYEGDYVTYRLEYAGIEYPEGIRNLPYVPHEDALCESYWLYLDEEERACGLKLGILLDMFVLPPLKTITQARIFVFWNDLSEYNGEPWALFGSVGQTWFSLPGPIDCSSGSQDFRYINSGGSGSCPGVGYTGGTILLESVV